MLEDFALAGNQAGKEWLSRIAAGIAGCSPALPNLAGMERVRLSWWRRALIRLAHSGR